MNTSPMSWQDVEAEVRRIAESVWATNAAPKVQGGIKCDVILKPKENYWIMIEVSKRDDLDKLRSDIIKLSSVRLGLMAKQTFCECYFITKGDHSSLVETGRDHNVEVYDLNEFSSKFIGTKQYLNERRLAPFGSAVDPDTGAKDKNPYTSTHYSDSAGGRVTTSDIANLVKSGKKVVLMGEFGTGKSRCLMEVFNHLSMLAGAFVPFAVNLRESWGYKRLNHIVQNHLDILGLGDFAPNLIRSLRRGNHSLLLDGFDEIGSQSWSGDPARLAEIRKKSLEGVRDLLVGSPGSGVLLTGREHYFNSDKEMAECLGLSLDDVVILRCQDEFSAEEADRYIKDNTSLTFVPEWMPKKPLICQLLAKLNDDEVRALADSATGEVEFFESVFDSICHRETRINPIISKDVLKDVFLRLAEESRRKDHRDEVITTTEINQAFFDVTGYAAMDEAAILLQRLPYLGRVGSGSADRIFIDNYAKDGIRGLALFRAFTNGSKTVPYLTWLQPIGNFGIQVLSRKLKADHESDKYARLCIARGNHQIGCDYITLKLFQSVGQCNFHGLGVSKGKFTTLDMSEIKISNLNIHGADIGEMIIEDSNFVGVSLSECVIEVVKGVGSADKLPNVFTSCEFGQFNAATTISRISELNLSKAHKTLLALIKKLFFQRGAGRQEDALLRGAESYWDSAVAADTLRYMLSRGIARKGDGDHGVIYIPQRKHTKRMARIWELQSSCGDELWVRVGSLS
jgi:hypothetical protein